MTRKKSSGVLILYCYCNFILFRLFIYLLNTEIKYLMTTPKLKDCYLPNKMFAIFYFSLNNEIPTREELLNELLLVEEHIESLGLPKVFCHNDPGISNHIYNKHTGGYHFHLLVSNVIELDLVAFTFFLFTSEVW